MRKIRPTYRGAEQNAEKADALDELLNAALSAIPESTLRTTRLFFLCAKKAHEFLILLIIRFLARQPRCTQQSQIAS